MKQTTIMQYYSTNNPQEKAGFRTATIKGQAPDKGLYFPLRIPQLPSSFIKELHQLPKEEIAFEVIKPYVDADIPQNVLNNIVTETIAFDFPLVPVNENSYALELFHGPTLAFKDVGARFMSRCLGYFMHGQAKKVTVLVATSGDTGGAVANGFYNVEGVDVIILYPAGKVSNIQELQLTTLGNNITAIAIDGSFDDCQQLVKQAFADNELNSRMFLTSANSINVARWLPQQFYYFFALQQWPHSAQPPVISVPSGNFGNICAGLLAYCSGLPVKQFIAACNVNDVVSDYLQTGIYTPKAAVPTISNAMDVGNPSNWVRVLELFDHQLGSLKEVMRSYCISDVATREIISNVYAQSGYLLDPHGAVGYLALQHYLEDHPDQSGIFLATAHPVKFFDVVEPIIKEKLELPSAVQQLLNKQKEVIRMKKDWERFREYLMDRR
ncbi:threonine synthase [Flavisolibacter tropicus]|nr:threonine synthase [Flavisolibacter tropicus]